MSDRQRRYYRGVVMHPSDLLKEITWAFVLILVLGLLLAGVFSSPDEPPVTAQRVTTVEPSLLLATGLRELAGQSAIAQYGPPYNHQSSSLQGIGPFSPQTWAGVQIPIDAPEVFVLRPLTAAAQLSPSLQQALAAYESAPAAQQQTWIRASLQALPKARYQGGNVLLPKGNYGPLSKMLDGYLQLGRSGLLEAAINQNGQVYQTDFTQALLLLENQVLGTAATSLNMLGNQWGMMREPDNYPGAVWLWLYTMLYQVPPYNTAPQADMMAGLTVALFSLLLLLVPVIPGLRDIPRLVPLHRLIWRRQKKP